MSENKDYFWNLTMGNGATSDKKKNLKNILLASKFLIIYYWNISYYVDVSPYEEEIFNAAELAISIEHQDCKTNIELSIQCEDLPKLDALSLTDAMVVAYIEKEYYTSLFKYR